VLGATALAAAPSLIHEALAATPAEQYVERVGNQILAIANSGASTSRKRSQFRSVLVNHVDIPTLATFALGPHARSLDRRHRNEYYDLLREHIADLFIRNLDDIRGDRLEITGSTRRGNGDYVVTSRILRRSRGDAPVNWRVISRGGRLRIFDVNISGVWLAIQLRSEFSSVINREGGRAEAILGYLRGRR